MSSNWPVMFKEDLSKPTEIVHVKPKKKYKKAVVHNTGGYLPDVITQSNHS